MDVITQVRLPSTLSAPSLERLAAQLEQSDGPRVLHGGGRVFCEGLELGDAHDEGTIERFVHCVRALRCGPPAVAFVAGAARGAGVGIAAACDYVLVSNGATFGLTELLFGLTPRAIWPLLCERVAPARLRWLAMTATSLDARQAIELGLADARASELAIAVTAAQATRRACPEAIRRLKADTAPIDQVRSGAAETHRAWSDPRVRARIARFLEGDTPWT